MKTEPVAFGIAIIPSFPSEASFFRPFIAVKPSTPAARNDDESAADALRSQVLVSKRRLGIGSFFARRPVRRFSLGLMSLLLGVVTLACAGARADQSVSLSWDTNAAPAAIGYALYIGTNSGNYQTRIDVGTNTTITLTGLKEGRTNYFTVAGYNSARVEGTLSPEIVFLVPGLVKLTSAPKAGNPASLKFPVAVGHWYEVQASVNLTSWSTIWQSSTSTSNAWLTFQDPQSTTFSKRFYRLVMH